MKHYELTCLISPELSKEEVDSLSKEISSLIQEKQGILEKSMPVLKKQLAYIIKKKTTAYLASLNFQLKPEELKELKKQIELNSKILRYLILTTKKETSVFPSRFGGARETKNKLNITSKTINIKKAKETFPKKKVELKELEKKLEEVLK